MNDRINMQDIIDLLAYKKDITKEEAERFVIELFNTIEEGLISDELVKIKDFGTFKLIDIQERESIDVNTQEKIIIPPHKRIRFTPAQALKSIVNKPFAHFETTPLNDGIVLENIKHDNASQNTENETEDEDTTEEITKNIKDNDSMVGKPVVAVDDDIDRESTSIIDNKSHSEDHKNHDEDISSSQSKDKQNRIEEETVESKEVRVSSKKASINRSKEKESKPKRPFLPWYIFTAVLIIFLLLFVYNLYQRKDTPIKHGIEKSDIPKIIKEPSIVVKDTLTDESVKPIETDETVRMKAGKTLRLIALDKYGSREFWVYIYLKNKDKINNPDVIPVGLELVLPNKAEYDIDAENPESIATAKKRGDEEMKRFW